MRPPDRAARVCGEHPPQRESSSWQTRRERRPATSSGSTGRRSTGTSPTSRRNAPAGRSSGPRRRGPRGRTHERPVRAAIFSREGTLRDTSTSLALARWSEFKPSVARPAEHIAREVPTLRHGEPVGVVAAAAAPRPQEAQAPQVVEGRPDFSLSFSPSRGSRALSSSSRVQYNLAAFPQSEVREGRLLTQQGAVLVAMRNGASVVEVGSWRYGSCPAVPASLAPLSAFPRSFSTPGTWETNTKEGGCRGFRKSRAT